jgi:hypothetical protein
VSGGLRAAVFVCAKSLARANAGFVFWPRKAVLPAATLMEQQSHRDESVFCSSYSVALIIMRIRRARIRRCVISTTRRNCHLVSMVIMLMNPRVVVHYRGDMAQSNIRPAIHECVLAQLAG